VNIDINEIIKMPERKRETKAREKKDKNEKQDKKTMTRERKTRA